MKYLIPKEIKSSPRLFGLRIKEWIILLIGLFLILTVFGEMVHTSFVFPFYIVSGLFLFWLILPSVNNRGKQNYESLYLLFKKDRLNYHPIDIYAPINQMFDEDE